MDVTSRPVGVLQCARSDDDAGSCNNSGSGKTRHTAPAQSPLGFAIRTTLAALVALACSQLLGIHHPWWAAMTVWLVAQPTRGLLIERILARLLGTTVGAGVGALILIFLAQNLSVALLALALWLALCAGLGTTFRHFRNYGFVLAGYTAGIVVLFGLGEGHTDGFLAQDRVLCTLIGIVCSAMFSFRALPSKGLDVEAQAQSLLQRVLRRLDVGHGPDNGFTLTAAIGAFDRAIDEQAAGSIRTRADVMRLRHISSILLELILLAPVSGLGPGAITDTRDDPLVCVRSLEAKAASGGQLALVGAIGELARVLEPARPKPWRHFRLDFDVTAAFHAAARPVLALAIAAGIWLSTGWQAGAMMAMTAVLFTSLFSSHDHGNHMVVQVLLGTLAGAVGGLLVRLFLLPHASGLLPTLVCITPFLLISAWLMRQTSTAKMAIDMAMTFLLTAQPGTAPVIAEVAMTEAAAIVMGVVIAVGIFWLIVPSTPDVRRSLLARRIARLTACNARNPKRTAAASRHQALRNAVARLLESSDAASPIFQASHACLAAASNARSLNCNSARDAALKASAALDALITSNPRRKCNA